MDDFDRAYARADAAFDRVEQIVRRLRAQLSAMPDFSPVAETPVDLAILAERLSGFDPDAEPSSGWYRTDTGGWRCDYPERGVTLYANPAWN